MDLLAITAEIASLLGIGAKQAWELLRAENAEAQLDVEGGLAAAMMDASRRVTIDGLGARFSEAYYSDDVLRSADLARYLVKVDGTTIVTSIATRPAWTGTRIPLGGGSESCRLMDAPAPAVAVDQDRAARIIAGLGSRGIDIWNGPIYRALQIDIEREQLRADFCLDQFFRYRFTNGSLHEELAQALLDADFDMQTVLAQSAQALPVRRQVLPPDSSLSQLGQRICASGVNVVLAFARCQPNSDFAIILQRRGTSVSTRQHALSVLPTAHHQPLSQPDAEVAISRTIMREVYEELFGGEETERTSARLQVDWYEQASEPMRWFRDHTGAYHLDLTACGISLLTGGLTFCAVLVVRDESFWKQYSREMRTNWEAAPWDPSTISSPVVSTRDPGLQQMLFRSDWMDYSYCSFVEALLYLHEVEPDRVDLPQISRLPTPTRRSHAPRTGPRRGR